MKLLVTGSRDWSDYELLRDVIAKSNCTIVVHGDARGADALAKRAAIELGIEHRPYPAKWHVYGRSAGPKRNQEMLDKEHLPEEPIELCLAFPLAQSIGTRDMMRRATAAGIQVVEVVA